MQTYRPPSSSSSTGFSTIVTETRVRVAPSSSSSSSSSVSPMSMITEKAAFLNACRDGQDDRIRHIMTSQGVSKEVVNHRDKTGKTGVNHICSTGNVTLLELISQIPYLDVNLGDNEGNGPLHFAAQAGHTEVLHHLVNHFKNINVDARNMLGFTPLMKASLQGRTKCVKVLLAAGASPVLRDYGRGLCSSEWARFCGRHSCAESLEKYMRSANYSPSRLRKQLKELDKYDSEPNLHYLLNAESKDGWFKQKLKKAFKHSENGSVNVSGVGSSGNNGRKVEYSLLTNLSNVALCASSPLVPAATVKGSSSAAQKATGLPTPPPSEIVPCDEGDSKVVMVLPMVEVSDASQVSDWLHHNHTKSTYARITGSRQCLQSVTSKYRSAK